jgi:hypothetical protein
MRSIFLGVLAFLIFAPRCLSQTPEEKKATIVFVQGLQSGGAFAAAPGEAEKQSLRATSAALRALKYFGGEAKDKTGIPRFVERCFDKTSGGFSDSPLTLKPDVTTTAVGLMAVVELKMPLEPYVEPAIKYLGDNAKTFEEIRIAAAGLEAVGKRPKQADGWLEEIAKLRNADGTYGKGAGAARATGSAVQIVLRLGGKVDQRDNVVKVLKTGQRADGAWGKEEAPGSDLETSYRVLRSLRMLKEKPDDAKLRAFVAKCRNADGGYGVAPGQKSSVGATYFASIILHWLDEK